MSDLSTGLLVWWLMLCIVSIINFGILVSIWVRHFKNKSNLDDADYRLQRQLIWLSTFLVLGCAFRSFLPRADVQRITPVDSWLSSILVGRSVATIAELCFVAQWALVLGTFARTAKNNLINTFSKIIIPAILIAEVFSWLGITTTNNFWHFIEESIWGTTEVLLTLSALWMWKLYGGSARKFLGWMAVCGVIYVTFMFTIYIPTYFSRWMADSASGKLYTGFLEGLQNITYHWTMTHRPQDWEGEFVWMVIYFSLAVWVSLALTQAPIGRLKKDFKVSSDTHT